MNFKDFFIFLARICLSDLVRISYLLIEDVSIFCNSCPISGHLLLNLGSIRRVANRMKSFKDFNFNIRETLDDPRFRNLRTVSEQTYGKIFTRQLLDHHSNGSPMCNFRDPDILRTLSSSEVSTPEDLEKFIHHVMFSNIPKLPAHGMLDFKSLHL